MVKEFTVEDFKRHLRSQWEQSGFTVPEGDQVGIPIASIVEHSRERSAFKKTPHIDLWVAVLDEHISWFVSLSSIVWNKAVEDSPKSQCELCLFLVINKVIADMMSIRHLVLAGFDTSARTILRSISECLEVLLAVIHQPSFADAFMKSDTPKGAQEFWQRHIRGGALRKRVEAAWQDFFAGHENTEAAKWFANWGRGSVPMLSGLAHPSLAGGLFSTIPLKAQYGSDSWPGFFGDKAEASVDTIYILLQFVFPVLLLDQGFPFDSPSRHFAVARIYDETDELHRHVKVGRNILASVILSVSDERNRRVFPGIDYNIWPSDD